MLLAAALAVGALVGLVSGLTGIGGGVLMVPFLYFVYGSLGIPRSVGTSLAHATSLAVIVPTAIRGLVGFRGTGLVQWRAAFPLALSGAVASAVTAQFATRVPADALRIGFGVFLLLVSIDLLLRRAGAEHVGKAGAGQVAGALAVGVPVGMISAALGVGGGVPATMGMHYLLGMPFRVVVPTSLAVIMVTGAAATLSYLVQPIHGLPFTGVVGHIDIRHGLPLAVGAVLASPLGVALNKRLPVLVLRRVFGWLLVLIGSSLIVASI